MPMCATPVIRGRGTSCASRRETGAIAAASHVSERCAMGSMLPLPLEIPEPEILPAGTVPVARLESAALGHGDGCFVGERHAEPGVVGSDGQGGVALHLKFEQRARAQQAVRFADVILDDVVARDVL